MVYQPQRQYQPMMPKYPLLAWPKDFKMLHFPLYIYGPREKEILEVLKGSSVGWMARLFGIGPLLASCLALDIYLKPLIIDFKCIPLLCVSCATLSLTTLLNVNSNFSPIDIKVRCLHSSLKKGFCWNVRPLLRTEEQCLLVIDRLTFIYWYE